jgi:hypothetical protein
MHYVNQRFSDVSYFGIEIICGARSGRRERPAVIWVTYAQRTGDGAICRANGGFEN